MKRLLQYVIAPLAVIAMLLSPLAGQQGLHAQQADRPQPWSNARFVYVSPQGDDSKNGTSADQAVKTVDRGFSLLRPGQPDWLVLQRGFDYELTREVSDVSGAAEAMPVVISAYGKGEAPELNVGPNADALNQAQQLAKHITVYDVTLTGLSNPFPILKPGSGFNNTTPEPGPIGAAGLPGYDAKAIAQWDVVPNQNIEGKFHIGVVAFHMNAIDRVSFSVDNGPWVDVHKMQYNPRTLANEYTVTLDADLFGQGDEMEVRAVVYPKDAGQPRLLEPLKLRKAPRNVNVVRITSQTTIVEGIGQAGDGGVVILNAPGRYTFGIANKSMFSQFKHPVTIKAADGLSRDNVIITQAEYDGHHNADMIRPHCVLHFDGVTFDYTTISRYFESTPWFNDCVFVGQAEHERSPHLVRGKYYVTNCLATDRVYGYTYATICRNSKITKIWGDALQGARLVVNCLIEDFDGTVNNHHPDLYQIVGPSNADGPDPDNYIVYGLKARGLKQVAAFFLEPTIYSGTSFQKTLRNTAFVNIDVGFTPSGDDADNPSGHISQLMSRFEHVLFKNIHLPDQMILLRNELPDTHNQVFHAKNVLFDGCTLHPATYREFVEPAFKLPSGVEFRNSTLGSPNYQ